MAKNKRISYGISEPLGLMADLPIIAQRAPTALDTNASIGTFWIDEVTNIVYCLTSVAGGAATWTICAVTAGFIATLTSDTGVPTAPVLQDIQLLGTANQITSTGVGNVITFSIPATLTVPGALNVNVGPTNIGGAGAAGANTINIGTSAFANIVSIGSVTGAASLTMRVGTGNFSLDGVGASIYTIGPSTTGGTMNFGGTGANTGAMTIAGGTGAQTINIANSTGGKTVAIATGAGANAVTIGSTNTTSATTIQSGTGDLVMTSTDRATIDAVGVLELNSSGAAIGIGNDADAFGINIGTGAAARTITIGNVTGATAVNVNSGTGACAWTTTNGTFGLVTGTGAISLGTDAFAKNITIGNVAGATAVNVNSGTAASAWTTTNGTFGLVTGTGAINLGADAVAKIITLGNQVGATSLIIDSGTVGTLMTSTGPISINSVGTSNFTATTAGTDLTLECIGGAVNVLSNQTENDAIVLNATAANGGVQIMAGTGGILIGNEADTTAITLGLVAPTATRNITIGGGTVVTAAVTDTVSIAPDGATTNANSIKTVNINTGGVAVGQVLTNIATGAVTSGTHTTAIATGNRAAGTMAVNILTGTGTKTLNIGNADGLTTSAIVGPVNVTGALSLTTAGNKLNIATGANASCGTATLVGGTIVVATTAVTANSKIFLTRGSVGATGAAALGELSVGAIVAATSFEINAWQQADATALQASDVSEINWLIIN